MVYHPQMVAYGHVWMGELRRCAGRILAELLHFLGDSNWTHCWYFSDCNSSLQWILIVYSINNLLFMYDVGLLFNLGFQMFIKDTDNWQRLPNKRHSQELPRLPTAGQLQTASGPERSWSDCSRIWSKHVVLHGFSYQQCGFSYQQMKFLTTKKISRMGPKRQKWKLDCNWPPKIGGFLALKRKSVKLSLETDSSHLLPFSIVAYIT